MMYLQKYLVRDVVNVLRVTTKLIYYPKTKLDGTEDSLNQALIELEASKTECKTTYQQGYDEGINTATESYKAQMLEIQDEIWAAAWAASLTKAGVAETSSLWIENDLPSSQVVPEEEFVEEENNLDKELNADVTEQLVADADQEPREVTNPGEKEASGGINVESSITEDNLVQATPSTVQIMPLEEFTLQEETNTVRLHPELKAEKAAESLCIFAENLCQSDKLIRISTLRILSHYQLLNYEHSPKEEPTQENMKTEVSHTCFADDRGCNVLRLLLSIEDTPVSVTTSRKVILLISRIQMGLSSARIAETYLPSVLYGIIGIFHNRFSSLWDPALDCMAVLISKYFDVTWDGFVQYLEQCQSNFLASNGQSDRSNSVSTCNSSGLVERFHFFLSPASDNNPCATVLSLLIRSLQKVPGVIESHSQQLVPLFLKFMGYNLYDLVNGGTFKAQAFKGKEWKNILKEWLTLLKSLRHPKSFYRSQFLKDVLQYRLLDENDAEIQMMVLDCLLNWKDDFLVPYDRHLKCLISSRSLREELTTWSLSKESNLIEESHRTYLVPFVIRILIPKVWKLKTLASRKHTSVHHRKAVLWFIAQLDVDELRLFFALLINPLLSTSRGFDGMGVWFLSSSEWSKKEFDSFSVLKYFTRDNAMALSWKKRYAFLQHAVELHINR